MNQKAFIVGIHRYSFQAGKPAEIIGVEFVTPENLSPRPCYKLRFEDGYEDFLPISEAHNFEIISEEDVRLRKIPGIVH